MSQKTVKANVWPWWDPYVALDVVFETEVDFKQVPCAACGEHQLLTGDDIHRHPWMCALCPRCINKPGLSLTLICRNGHKLTVTNRQIKADPWVTRCECGSGSVKSVGHLSGISV